MEKFMNHNENNVSYHWQKIYISFKEKDEAEVDHWYLISKLKIQKKKEFNDYWKKWPFRWIFTFALNQ